jgi:hypothetical protein
MAKKRTVMILGRYLVCDVLPHRKAIGTPDEESIVVFGGFGGVPVKMNLLKYQIHQDSTVCADCGMEGFVMLLEKINDLEPNFVLCGQDEEGDLVRMTKGNEKHPEGNRTTCERCMNKWSSQLQRNNNAGGKKPWQR